MCVNAGTPILAKPYMHVYITTMCQKIKPDTDLTLTQWVRNREGIKRRDRLGQVVGLSVLLTVGNVCIRLLHNIP